MSTALVPFSGAATSAGSDFASRLLQIGGSIAAIYAGYSPVINALKSAYGGVASAMSIAGAVSGAVTRLTRKKSPELPLDVHAVIASHLPMNMALNYSRVNKEIRKKVLENHFMYIKYIKDGRDRYFRIKLKHIIRLGLANSFSCVNCPRRINFSAAVVGSRTVLETFLRRGFCNSNGCDDFYDGMTFLCHACTAHRTRFLDDVNTLCLRYNLKFTNFLPKKAPAVRLRAANRLLRLMETEGRTDDEMYQAQVFLKTFPEVLKMSSAAFDEETDAMQVDPAPLVEEEPRTRSSKRQRENPTAGNSNKKRKIS